MHRSWLLAVGAGLVSSAAFLGGVAAGLKGSVAGFMLVYLAPAPLFAAALGSGGAAGIIASAVGLAPVVMAAGLEAGGAYAALIGMPAAVLGRQAMLSRINADGGFEWYPPGALAGWLFAIGAVIYALLCALLGSQPAGLSGTVREMLTELAGLMQMADDDLELFMGLLHPIFPGMAIATLMLIQVANGALAQGLLAAAGRAVRPSPDFGAMVLPGWIATVAAAAALCALVVGDEFGYFARNLVIVAMVPFFLQGLSVVHVLARRTGGGTMLLTVFYVMLIVLGWIVIVLVLLGLVEQVAGLRRRMTRGNET